VETAHDSGKKYLGGELVVDQGEKEHQREGCGPKVTFEDGKQGGRASLEKSIRLWDGKSIQTEGVVRTSRWERVVKKEKKI